VLLPSGAHDHRDYDELRELGLKAERIKLEGDPAAAVRSLTERISALLQGS
jgi:hypothetical protein